MRPLTLAAVVLGLALSHNGWSQPQTCAQTALTGTWQYDGFFYDGHRYPNPNPDLIVKFTFLSHVSRLIWSRTNEPGFCERKAEYSIHDNFLHQKVTWLNPSNLGDCSNDPDMQMGRETEIRFALENSELHLYFDIDGKEFLYILRRLDPSETGCPTCSQSGPLIINW